MMKVQGNYMSRRNIQKKGYRYKHLFKKEIDQTINKRTAFTSFGKILNIISNSECSTPTEN